MHIKSIHLKGFKSYKDQLVDLTQGTNVFGAFSLPRLDLLRGY